MGKTPLINAFARINPKLFKKMKKLVLYNSRPPRPGEIDGQDYFFRSEKEIRQMQKNNDFLLFEARGYLQALDFDRLKKLLTKSDVFYEGNPFIALELYKHPAFSSLKKLGIFLSPLSQKELKNILTGQERIQAKKQIAEMMRRKLLRRNSKYSKRLTESVKKNIEIRVQTVYEELTLARQFDFVIPNHDGEDSDNWDLFDFPIGDAAAALKAFANLVQGKKSKIAEKWRKDII